MLVGTLQLDARWPNSRGTVGRNGGWSSILPGLWLVLGLLLALGCSRRESPSSTPADPPALAANNDPKEEHDTKEGAVRTSSVAPAEAEEPGGHRRRGVGSIAGRVVYRGELPTKSTIVVPEAGTLPAHTIRVDESTRGLSQAAVWVDSFPDDSEAKSVLPPLRLDQRNWMFVPHVLALRRGQPIEFTNSDIANHNIHSWTRGHEFNLGSPGGTILEHRFQRATGGKPIRIECDLHEWMRAWIYVFEHRAFAVTDAAGAFRIDSVPAGTWKLHVHHADGDLQASVEIEVAHGAPTTIEIEATPK